MYRLARIAAALVFILTLAMVANVGATPAVAGSSQTYLVLYKGNAVAADAISKAGGTLVANYSAIGVAVARSSSASFAATIRKDNRIEGAVVAFIDIDDLKRTQAETAAARDFAEAIVETVRDPLLALTGDLRVRSANTRCVSSVQTQKRPTTFPVSSGIRLYDQVK